jgi:hypothetical protein
MQSPARSTHQTEQDVRLIAGTVTIVQRETNLYAWVKNTRLWQAAQQKAAKEEPRYTRRYWERTAEIYQKAGGSLVEDENLEGDEE